jgi:hypothetical protein
MAISDQTAVLSALSKAEGPIVLEEIAAMASISYERAWYASLELLELRLMTPGRDGTLRPYSPRLGAGLDHPPPQPRWCARCREWRAGVTRGRGAWWAT